MQMEPGVCGEATLHLRHHSFGKLMRAEATMHNYLHPAVTPEDEIAVLIFDLPD
jgi:hypothetical protein